MKENTIDNEEKMLEINDYVAIDLTDIKANVTYRYFYQIVDDKELEKGDNYNKVSVTSPLGSRLLLGKIGDSGKYKVCGYHYKYTIINIFKNEDKDNIFDSNLTEEVQPKVRTRK